MSGTRRGVIAVVRRLLGLGERRPAARPSAAPVAPPIVTPPPAGTPEVQLRWFKERPVRASRDRAAPPPPNVRQRVLALVAAVSVVTVLVILAAQSLRPRSAPRVVRGLWSTDAEAYRGRHLEIQARRVAFQTSAAEVAVYPITRAWQSREGDSTTVRLELRETGMPLELSIVHLDGPPERLRFAHQRTLVWTRVPGGRTIMPGF